MLQKLRQSTKGTPAKIVVGLIVISFAFFGIQSILLDGGGSEIAVVNGQDIYPQELEQAVVAQKRRLFAMMGENVDPAMLDDDRLRPRALEALINRNLLVQSAQVMELTVSEREIGAVVGSTEQFQVDGVFSPDKYKGVLSSAGYTPGSYKLSLRDDLLLNQVSSGLAASEFVTPTELELNAKVMSENRDFRYFTIPQEKFISVTPATESQIETYYNANLERFRTLESVDLEYLELAVDEFRQPVEESAILGAYELAKDELQYQTQSRVSHILFESDGDAGVRQRIAEAQKKLSSGVSFSEVAQEVSEDAGSAERGGDLGYTSGEAFPEEMETTIAQLEPGIVSDPIETEAGTHLILVTERKPGEVVTLEEVRAQLEADLQLEEARVDLLRTVESLRDLTFNADNLSDPAIELDLIVKNEKAVTRSQNEGLFSNSALLEAAFSDEVLSSGHNSEVIELPGERFVVLRVSQHLSPEVMTLDSVREAVVAAVSEEAVREAVATEANNALEQLRSGLEIEQYVDTQGYDLQVELGVDRRNNTVPTEVLRRTFELPPPADGIVSTDFIITPNGDAVVIDLQRVSPGVYTSLVETEQEQLQRLLTGEYGSLVYQEYQRGLRERAEITVL
jgi:peptidyl-prolyl cis-trans isomerase D